MIISKYKGLLIYTPMFLVCLFLNASCKKFIEVKAPITSVPADIVYSNDATAAGVLTSIYYKMQTNTMIRGGSGITSITPYAGLSADELILFDQSDLANKEYYTNSLTPTDLGSKDFWSQIYPIVFVSNSAIEGLSKATSLTPTVKSQLLGEAKFMRAFCYFYLVNLYGKVPLILTTDFEKNRLMARTRIDSVYNQIIIDLQDAQTLLNENYLAADTKTISSERVRPNKYSATALLSRIDLYKGNYPEAEAQASIVINDVTLYDTVSFNSSIKVFDKNSKEAIWQLQPIGTGKQNNTPEGNLFVLRTSSTKGPNSNQPFYLSDYVMNRFEPGDLRGKIGNWVDSVHVGTDIYYYPNKYKVGNGGNSSVKEYSMVLRLAEQYLIRAEARAQQNNLPGAIADLDVIRRRARLPLIANTNPGINKSALLDAIFHEKQVEFFTEWGQCWLDLKRTGQIDNVMSIVTTAKGGTWNTNSQYYPIVLSELDYNPNMIQNEGY
jgi:hypothetical protein